MDANNDCRRNVTGLECIRKECMQPNAWFHWAHAVDDASKWAAASTYINYDIVMPETSKQAIQLFRRTNVVEEWWLLLIGGRLERGLIGRCKYKIFNLRAIFCRANGY